MEQVRVATAEDLPRVLELVALARAELLGERGGELWAVREARPEPQRHLPVALDDPAQRIVVGLIDDYIVGYATARIEPLRDGSRLGVVDDVYVEPPFRSVSVGELLLEDLWAWCRAQGCRGIDSIALPGMRETKNFFERFGMKARALLVHASFEEPSDAAGSLPGGVVGGDDEVDRP